MIIAVNTRALSGNLAVSRWLVDCVELLAILQPTNEFIFIAEKKSERNSKNLKNVKRIILPQQSDNPLLWKLWYNYKLPALLKKNKVDILISADGACSLGTKIPQYLLVNDLAFLHYPEWYCKKYVRFTKSNTPACLQKAKLVLTFSSFLMNDIIKQYRTDERKISVLPAGTASNCSPLKWEDREAAKEKYAEGKEYFLFSGAIHTRSNLVNLLKAFSLFKKKQKSNMQLIIASRDISEDASFVESLKLYKYRNEVKLMVRIDEDMQKEINSAAYACINLAPLHNDITSLIFAMQFGVPVIAGNLFVAIELLDQAVLFADASSPEQIAERLMLLYKDEAKRNELGRKAMIQSSKYHLSEAAVALWENICITMQPA